MRSLHRAATCPYGYGNNPNGAGCYCGPGQTPYLVGANPYCIPPPVDANGNPVYPNNLGCANGWDQSAQACVCGPGDAPMSVVGPSGVDCVEPATATYSAGPQAVPLQSQARPVGSGSRGHREELLACDALGHCTQVIGVDPPSSTAGPPLSGTGTSDLRVGGCGQVNLSYYFTAADQVTLEVGVTIASRWALRDITFTGIILNTDTGNFGGWDSSESPIENESNLTGPNVYAQNSPGLVSGDYGTVGVIVTGSASYALTLGTLTCGIRAVGQVDVP